MNVALRGMWGSRGDRDVTSLVDRTELSFWPCHNHLASNIFVLGVIFEPTRLFSKEDLIRLCRAFHFLLGYISSIRNWARKDSRTLYIVAPQRLLSRTLHTKVIFPSDMHSWPSSAVEPFFCLPFVVTIEISTYPQSWKACKACILLFRETTRTQLLVPRAFSGSLVIGHIWMRVWTHFCQHAFARMKHHGNQSSLQLVVVYF